MVLRISREATEAERTRLKFEIRDTGVGIPDDRIAHLFRSFTQVDASTTRKYGGTGLGLAISKRLVELMGGEIGVRSAAGAGSTFWFTTELTRSESDSAAHTPAGAPGEVRVLAVDDNATNREIIHEQLNCLGYANETAEGAEEALVKLRAAAKEGHPFDVAILDMLMPGIDGEQLAQLIKAVEALRDIALLLLSSAVQCKDSARLKELGFSGWLAKPIWRSILGESIQAALDESEDAPVEPEGLCDCQRRYRARSEGARVLLADDNEIGREIVTELLHRAGFKCDAVQNGRQAVEAAQRGGYDAVLMDCQMPVMDGFDATRVIRDWESTQESPRRLPIIALTANAINGDEERCRAAGMDDYLPKPLDPAHLMEALDRHLVRPGETVAAEAEAPPIAFEACLKRWGSDPEFIGRMIGKFIARVPDDIAALERAFAAGDDGQVIAVAHATKGAASFVGACGYFELAADIEARARVGDLAGARTGFAALRAEAERCTAYAAQLAERKQPAAS
ncbi:MAG TPA: response regulator [Phycisphaerae bacterium]|nr:response regulator [Phycisphaerae bacterium]